MNAFSNALASALLLGSAALAATGCFSDNATPDNAGGASSGTGGATGTGGAGGSGGTGGSAGSGGDTTADTGAPGGGDMIDDMEDNDGSIASVNGRVGAWYTYNDATPAATQVPKQGDPFTMTAGGREGSGYCANTHGSGFTLWGAGYGFNFKDPGDGDGGSKKTTYDASAYAGITLWAKAGPTSDKALRVNVSNKETDPDGAVCAPADKCSDHFGSPLTLTGEWAKYTLPFAKMAQSGWGQSVAKFDVSTLYAVQFQVGKNATFDISIDEVAFLPK
ncbi:MAG TPA: hypothetical protein VK550_33445 [Polyangiaceae bacterium]|nr:hypothetical protein [Polyangiaceae bacterium]